MLLIIFFKIKMRKQDLRKPIEQNKKNLDRTLDSFRSNEHQDLINKSRDGVDDFLATR